MLSRTVLIGLLFLLDGCSETGRKFFYQMNQDTTRTYNPANNAVVAPPLAERPAAHPNAQLWEMYGFDSTESCEANRLKIWPACWKLFGTGPLDRLFGDTRPKQSKVDTMLDRCLDTGYEVVYQDFCSNNAAAQAPEPAQRNP